MARLKPRDELEVHVGGGVGWVWVGGERKMGWGEY